MTTSAEARRTDYLPLDDLAENPANPKEHELGLMGSSVGRFGFIEPMVLDERTGYLISGHGRKATLARLRDQGQQPPSGVTTDEAGGWLVPVTRGWSSSSDAEASAALAALNRVGEKGGWNDLDLLALLQEVSKSDQGLTGVGFNDIDLGMLQRLAEAEAVYTTGVESMLDEFRSVTGEDAPDYVLPYAAKVAVYIRDAEALEEFRTRLGLDEVAKVNHYPTDWTPYPAQQEEAQE